MRLSFKGMVLALLLAGRVFAQTCTTDTPTPTPLPQCTGTPTFTPTRTPTPTNTSIPTNTPTPTPTLSGGSLCLWAIHQGGTTINDNVAVLGVRTDSSGNVYATGGYTGTVNFGGVTRSSTLGSNDVFLAKYNSSGVLQWVNTYGSTLVDFANAVSVDASGNVVITGRFGGTVDFGGGPLTSTTSAGLFIAKYTNSGTHIWSAAFSPPSGLAIGQGVAATGTDTTVVGIYQGTMNFGGSTFTSTGGGQDVFIAKYNSAGVGLWSHSYGGSGSDSYRSVAADASSNLYVSGDFSGAANFGGGNINSLGIDGILVKYDSSGAFVWQRDNGGTGGTVNGFSVSADTAGNPVIAGSYQGSVDFGGGAIPSAGSLDIFVAKYAAATGAFTWMNRYGTSSGFGEAANAVVVDGGNNVIFTGQSLASIDFGSGGLGTNGTYDAYVTKLNSSGGLIWARRGVGVNGDDHGYAVAVDLSNNVLAGGQFVQTLNFGCPPLSSTAKTDGYLVKLSP